MYGDNGAPGFIPVEGETQEPKALAPNTADVQAMASELSPEQRALLIVRLRKKAGARASQCSSLRTRSVPREQDMPLSFAQQRLWFLDQLEPGNPVYNLSVALRVNGLLDIAALEFSVNEILRRHEVLRTTFVSVNGRPAQVIFPSLKLPLPLIDLREMSADLRESEVQEIVAAQGRQPFDLSRGPMLRVSAMKLAEQEHAITLTMHHIISDAWSMGVLVNEVAILYDVFSTGKANPLKELPIQYADFAVWQCDWMQGEVLKEQLDFWKQALAGAAAVLELPADFPRPEAQSFQGARQSLVVSKELTDSLKELSRRTGVTLFMTLLAAFQTLLYRYTGQGDILVGTPVANRNREEIEKLIGCFANTLVLRTKLSNNPTFSELLQRVREVALGAYAHQDLPFEKLVESLRPERKLSHHPLFQVCFDFHKGTMKPMTLPGLTLVPIQIENATAKFDLVLEMYDTENRLEGTLEYNSELFSPARISSMLGHFTDLLGEICMHPNWRLLDFPMIADERGTAVQGPHGVEAADDREEFDFQL